MWAGARLPVSRDDPFWLPSHSVGTKISADSGTWKTPYFVFGFIGIAFAALVMFTVRDPTFKPSTKRGEVKELPETTQPLLAKVRPPPLLSACMCEQAAPLRPSGACASA